MVRISEGIDDWRREKKLCGDRSLPGSVEVDAEVDVESEGDVLSDTSCSVVDCTSLDVDDSVTRFSGVVTINLFSSCCACDT